MNPIVLHTLKPLLRGWIGYYGRCNRAALETMLRHVVRIQPAVFEHWRIGMIGAFAYDGSGVRRESHAPFCERLAAKYRRPTHQPFALFFVAPLRANPPARACRA
jgi:hypothetical protein